jgi:hypothetical protein
MSKEDVDQLRADYKQAVDEWVQTIRDEEALATPNHSMIAWEKWDAAHFKEHDEHLKVREKREAYKDELCHLNYGI